MNNEKEWPESANLTDIIANPGRQSGEEQIAKAVALKYDANISDAPNIVASGKGVIAEQILQLAFAHGVKVREDADLAELLSHIDIDSPIPLEAYAAVAEILAYVYTANAKRDNNK